MDTRIGFAANIKVNNSQPNKEAKEALKKYILAIDELYKEVNRLFINSSNLLGKNNDKELDCYEEQLIQILERAERLNRGAHIYADIQNIDYGKFIDSLEEVEYKEAIKKHITTGPAKEQPKMPNDKKIGE